MKFSLALLLGLTVQCVAADPVPKEKDYSDQAYACSQKVGLLLRDRLSNAPRFTTLRDATKWTEERLPTEVKTRFVEAGRSVSRSLADWEQHGMIHGPFWNLQALSELLIAQSNRFNGIAACELRDDLGVMREIVQDQMFIALDLKSNPIVSMTQLGVSDPHYTKLALMYGVILDFAKVPWQDGQIAQVAKFRLEQPSE
jgi:hypothetical protein